MADPERPLLDEQADFYRRRAPEYDEWWQRTGPYDRGPAERADWLEQVGRVDAALAELGVTGNVLELAGGTGWWTQRLAAAAERLTVVDASAEAIALNRDRVGRRDVTYEVADVFSWTPRETGAFDLIFFSFWLSHVPRPLFGHFWNLVRAWLAPEGAVFFIDNRWDPTWDRPDPHVVESRADVQVRRLSDGSTRRVVKVFYEPAELEGLLRAEGWSAEVDGTRWLIYGSARRV